MPLYTIKGKNARRKNMIYISDIDPRHYITGSTLRSLSREERAAKAMEAAHE